MGTDSAPVWVQQAIGAGLFFASALGALIVGRKGKTEQPGGEAKVLAASIVSHTEIKDLTLVVQNLHGSLNELVGLMKAAAQREHDRAVVEAELAKRGIKP